MAHGAPDDSNVVKQGDVYRLDDMAELAARLGSPVSYHRFGTVIWTETFEGGLGGVTPVETHPGAKVYVQSLNWRSEGVAAELHTEVADPEAAGMRKTGGYYRDTTLGFSVEFCNAGVGNIIRQYISYYDGSVRRHGAIRITPPSGVIEYQNESLTWVPCMDVGVLDADGLLWYPIKLILDTFNCCYIRFHFGDQVVDLSGIALYQEPCVEASNSRLLLWLNSPDATERSVYTDNWVFTVNEEV